MFSTILKLLDFFQLFVADAIHENFSHKIVLLLLAAILKHPVQKYFSQKILLTKPAEIFF